MTAATDQDIQQIKDLITGLDKKIDIGFAQVDVKLANLEKKIDVGLAELKGQMNTGFARVEGDINLLKQPRDFWDFVRRAVTSGLVVTVVGGLLLSAWKLLIFGQVI
jgi:hypothetical protein